MRERLRIGEVAKLLGVTTKTVRHYHKVGLLAEPRRTAGGYRLYGAGDLLRLHRIRRLQALGLSLKQIGAMLGAPADEHSLRDVLRSLHQELSAQIAALEGRRERIARLLAGDLPAAIDRPSAAPPTLEMLERMLEEHLPEVSPALRRQEEGLWAILDAFEWPEGLGEVWRNVAGYYTAHPEQLRQLHALSERMVALAGLPEDAPEIAQLAAECARYLRDNPLPPELAGAMPTLDGALAGTLGDLLGAELSPAQRRLMKLVQRHGAATGGRPAGMEASDGGRLSVGRCSHSRRGADH